jgi:thiol-disulfide isomerase/thioredoxin
MSTVNPTPQSSRVRANRPDLFVMLLLAASLGLNVYLGFKIRRGPVAENTAKLLPGTKVDPVNAIGFDGKPLTISYEGTNKPTVFYVLSPSCIWCRRNQANIEKLAETKGNDFRFIGLSLDEAGLKEYVEEYRLKFPVYAGLTKESVQSLRLGGTPQTIIVSSEGKVLKVWSGAYIESMQPDVEAFFGTSLPGLTSLSN